MRRTRRGRRARGHAAVRAELARVWSQALGVEPGPADTFGTLGGSSLAVEEVIVGSRTTLVLPLTVADFHDDPTLDEQAARLLRRHRGGFGAGDSSCQQLRPGATPALFCFAGAGASAAWFLPLVSALSSPATGKLAVYGVQAHGLQSRSPASWTVRGAARRHARALAAAQPHGPYLLVGHSFGGMVALETARLLRVRGHQVAQVILLDTVVDADAALGQWSDKQEGFTGTAATCSRPARPVRLAADLALAAGAGMVRYDLARQKRVFWELGMRAQRRYRVRADDCAEVTVLLTVDAPGQAERWRELGVSAGRVHAVPGGHLSMVTEPAVHAVVETTVAAATTG
ncbi:alpha/beta fold hydrolase [Nocardia sp. IBHARD005]|uniref:alpha/beta fold hydrolase n=1 Tax=Nocardia sp. IBHARD005 TaxID=3457765 RepID=UPI0040589498